MDRSGIICGGNWIVDRVKHIDRYPAEDTLANISAQSEQNGGCAFNVLVDLSKLGASFPLVGIGMIGEDSDASFIRSLCTEHRIETGGLLSTSESPTSYTDVMTVDSTGRRTFFHQRGANALLDVDHFSFDGSTARHFHLGYLLLLDRLDLPDAEFGTRLGAVLSRACEAGLSTSVDLVSEDSHRFRTVVLPTLPHVDICFANEFELSRTTGMDISLFRSPSRPGEGSAILGELISNLRTATQILFDAGLRELAVIHTPEFGYVRTRTGEEVFQPSLPIDAGDIKGTVGAGDAFAAGFLFGYHEGRQVAECLKWALQAARSCLRGDGASNGITALTGSV
jgi:sugar/nucleoside kinase (ribokinase family)